MSYQSALDWLLGQVGTQIKGSLRIKKCHRKWKKSKIQNLDFLIRGGEPYFHFFPNVNAHFRYFSWRENKVVLKWFLGNFKCFKLKFHVLRGGSENSKFSQFQNFPKVGTRGARQISNFFQIQKSPNHPRGGWVKKIVDFFHFLGHFLFWWLPLEYLTFWNRLTLQNQIGPS